MSDPTQAPRRRWWWWKALAATLLVGFGVLAILPWLIAAGPFRSRVSGGLDRAFAPGQLRFERLELSWFGPTRLDRVRLLDPGNVVVLESPTVSLDRTFAGWLFRDRGPVVLTIEKPSVRVTRSEDGPIDLVEALKTVLASPDPERDVTIRVVDGSLRYLDPFLAEPAIADAFDLTIRVPYAPSPVTWSAKLARGDAALECQGEFDTWLSKGGPPRAPELQVAVVGKRWPFVARTAGLDATGRLIGSLDFARKRGHWVFSGDARLEGLNAKGKALSGDTLAFDKLEAGWDLLQEDEGWKIRRLSASTPLGRIRAEGDLGGVDGRGKQRIEGRLDLAEIARQLPHALHLRDGLKVESGTARVAVDLTSSLDRTAFDVEAQVSDLAARDRDRAISLKVPATFQARLTRQGGESQLERLSVHTSFLDASAQGRLDEGVTLLGTIDLGGLRKQASEWVDLGDLELSGKADLSGTYRARPDPRGFDHSLKADLKDLRVGGVGLGSIRRDSASIEWTVDGPADPSGFPEGWKRVGLAMLSGKSIVRVGLEAGEGPTRLSASASTPIAVGDRSRLAKLELAGRRSVDGLSLEFDRVLAVLEPASQAAVSSRIVLASTGKFDLPSGDLILEPSPDAEPGSLLIDPEGLRLLGLRGGLNSFRFDGGVSGDLEGLDRLVSDLTGRVPMGLEGRWSAVGHARGAPQGVTLLGNFELVEPARAKGTRPNALALRALYSPTSDRLDLPEFTLSTTFGTLDASGKMEEVGSDRVVDLKGVLSPDFEAINAVLSSRIEPGARVEGKPRAFRASGPLGGDASKGWRGVEAEGGFDLTGADIYGMKFGPSPVVVRAARGQIRFDPIATTLNEGHIRLEPEVDLDAQGGPVLRLGKNSGVREARINDEVSKRVLAFVAPILDQATTAKGLVSVDLDHAEFPLGPGRGRQAKVEGAVVFQDVEFAPGPIAREILGVIGRPDLTLKLDQPVTLTIADGRVRQRGMSLPIGDLTRIELDGWVDFDRNLALNANIPVTPAMLGNNPLLSDIAAGAKVRLPIGGTLDRPQVDREAFALGMQDLGKSLLTRGATRGAMELLMRLARPRDPNAPPPPTAEERKAMRQEKKAQRRGQVPPPVDPPRP